MITTTTLHKHKSQWEIHFYRLFPRNYFRTQQNYVRNLNCTYTNTHSQEHVDRDERHTHTYTNTPQMNRPSIDWKKIARKAKRYFGWSFFLRFWFRISRVASPLVDARPEIVHFCVWYTCIAMGKSWLWTFKNPYETYVTIRMAMCHIPPYNSIERQRDSIHFLGQQKRKRTNSFSLLA